MSFSAFQVRIELFCTSRRVCVSCPYPKGWKASLALVQWENKLYNLCLISFCPFKEQHPKCDRTVAHFHWRKQSPGSEKCAFQYCPSTYPPDGHGQARPPDHPWHDGDRFHCDDAHAFHQNRDAAPWLCCGHPAQRVPPRAARARGGLRQEPHPWPVHFQHPAPELPEADTGLHLLRDFQGGCARGTKRGSCSVCVCVLIWVERSNSVFSCSCYMSQESVQWLRNRRLSQKGA